MAELLCSKQALAEVRCLQEQHHVTEGSRCCVFSPRTACEAAGQHHYEQQQQQVQQLSAASMCC
jgi:hypothetical protein